jgi:hypothetical protein
MRLLRDLGGEYVFCDTDSLFVVANREGTLRDEDAGERHFITWDRAGDLVEMSGRRRRSEHGLGHLLPPEETDELDNTSAHDRWWEHLLCGEFGVPDEEPWWFAISAAGRLRVSSPREEARFHGFNEGRRYGDRVRPFNFLNLYHVHTIARGLAGVPRCVVGSFERDPERWHEAECFNRGDRSGRRYRLRTDDPHLILPESVPAQTLGDYFGEYRSHPESKFAAEDGAPCRPGTRGTLEPRHIAATERIRIGKEATRLTEEEPIEQSEERVVEYRQQRSCRNCRLELRGRQRDWCSEKCRKREYRRSLSQGRISSRSKAP